MLRVLAKRRCEKLEKLQLLMRFAGLVIAWLLDTLPAISRPG
jgi:hypothetical protein